MGNNAGLNLCLPFAILSGSGLWLLSPPFRYLFSTPEAHIRRIPGFAHIIRAKEIGSCEEVCPLRLRVRAGARAFRLLNSERNAQGSLSASDGFFHGVYPVALIEADGTGEEVEETAAILSHGHRGRMERGSSAAGTAKGLESRDRRRRSKALGSSWPLSSQDAPFSCKMPLDHIESQSSSLIHSVSEHRTPPCPARGSVPRAVRQRQERLVVLGPLSPPQSACWQ